MKSFASVNLSQKVFSRLLVLYPREYREEFGPHMSQLFKDCSREALALRGTTGLITLWLATLPDLFKTAFEENFKEITYMSKEKFHRLGSWALALSALLLWLSFAVTGMETSTYDPLGGRDAFIEYFRLIASPVAILLMFVAVAALRSRYGDAVGPVASNLLVVSAIGSLVGVVGAIGLSLLLIPDGPWWYLTFGGTIFTLLGIGVFGIYCMRNNILPRTNWLLAFGGLALPVLSLIFIVTEMITQNAFSWTIWVSQVVLSLALLALLAAGLQLQGTNEKSAKLASR